MPIPYPILERLREEARTLDDVAGTLGQRAWPLAVREGGRGLSVAVAPVTGNFFRVLGSQPFLGRMLRPEDDVVGAAPVMVISHGLWRRHFGGDPDALGRDLTLHQRGMTYRVVGVAPPGLEYPAGTEAWVPLIPYMTPRDAETYTGQVEPLGRLAPAVTLAQASAELQLFLVEEFGDRLPEPPRAFASPLPQLVVGDVRPALLVLSAAAALLLLIACINVASLLLVGASGRAEEMAVRSALGAGRGRLLRQLLTESSLLAVAGGLLGAVLAVGLVQALLALAPLDLPRLDEIRLTGVPLGLAAGVTAAAVLVFGLIPALWTSGEVASPLRAGKRSATEPKARRSAQGALVLLQVALAVVVLAVAGLLTRSLRELQTLHMGFTADRLVIGRLAWPSHEFDNADDILALYERLIPRIEALPEVASATLANAAPFAGTSAAGWDGAFVAESRAGAEPAARQVLNMEVVGSDYFRTLGVPLLQGRGFTEADREGARRVAVVSEAAARLFWPDEDPIGQRIGAGLRPPSDPEAWWTVVGVVPESRYRYLREPAPTVYRPYRQFTDLVGNVRTLVVRTNGDPADAVPSIRRTLHDTDPDILLAEAQTVERRVASQLTEPRLSATLLGVFGVGALVLAAVGLYAVLAFVVRQRTRELAIRHALGASPSHLRALVLRQAAVIAGAGVVLGLAVALAGGRLLRSLLFGVSPADPLALAGAAATLLAVALAASYIPARRATRADALAVLRED